MTIWGMPFELSMKVYQEEKGQGYKEIVMRFFSSNRFLSYEIIYTIVQV